MKECENTFHNSNNEVIELDEGIRTAAYNKLSAMPATKMSIEAEVDIDQDGRISVREVDSFYRKKKVQRIITIVSFIVLILMTIYLFVLADNEKIGALDSAMDICYIVFGGIVGAYFGVELLDKRR